MAYLDRSPHPIARAQPQVKPRRDEFALILRRMAIEIAKRGLDSYNHHEVDKIGLACWSLRNLMQYGEEPFDGNGQPWPKSEF